MNPIIFELSLFVTSLICASSINFKDSDIGDITRTVVSFSLVYSLFTISFRIAKLYLDVS